MTAKGSRSSLRPALVAGLLAGAFALVAAPPASAATIVSGPLAAASGYLTPNTTIGAGESVDYMNLDLVAHDVTSEAIYRPKRKRGKPRPSPRALFRSELIGFGQSSALTGIERAKPGQTYPFYCSIHPSMLGSVTVR
jgi:plastocyanin